MRGPKRRTDHAEVRAGAKIYQAELGERHPSVCAMQGLNAVEIVSDYREDTYRGVYTTRLKGFFYGPHAFKTPKRTVS